MTDSTAHDLRELHDRYVHDVNAAVTAGREALAAEIAQDYPDHALRLLTAAGTT